MKFIALLFKLFVCCCIGLLSCKEKIPKVIEDKQLYEIQYDFSGFEKEYGNIGPPLSAGKSSINTILDKRADAKNLEARRLLYSWNFDSKKLDPNFSNTISSKLYFDKQTINYVPGFNSINNPSDFAIQETGIKTFYIEINVKHVKRLDVLEFDIASGNQSPKLINLKVQNNQGQTIQYYSEDFKLMDRKTPFKVHNARFDLSKLPIDQTEIKLLISFLPNPDDKETSVVVDRGTVLIDNIKIHGYLNNIALPKLAKFHYYVFQKENKKLFSKGIVEQKGDLSNLVIKLPYGDFENLFVYNQSEEDLLVSNDINFQTDFYLSIQPNNKHARVFSNLDQIQVSQSFKRDLPMKRLYSLIKFSFTDLSDLSEVKKLVIYPLHEPILWSPFSNSILLHTLNFNEKPIEIVKNFSMDPSAVFNQFIGNVDKPKIIRYQVEVWDDKQAVRNFQVTASIKNNVQLTFKGLLNPKEEGFGHFISSLNEDWDGEDVVEYQ